ncbi:hypothetical protein [Bacillus massiliigorillae]|uniref:hypothetical protein n=1 Tax=Bacillus massiliigorillae TaxID=1243664 RepID=UPI0003A5DBEC|nr:hypothetical protein [Bacillus massiliigorillae]
MLKERLAICTIFSLLLILFIYFAIDRIKIQNLKNITLETIHSKSFNNVIESANVERNKSTITIRIELVDPYDDLKVIEQYAVFEYLNRQIRHYLLTGTFQNSFYNYDFNIFGRTKLNNYLYSNPVTQKGLAHATESTFKINEQKVYNKRTFQNEIHKFRRESLISNREKEILQYADKIFMLISSAGKYHNHKMDSKIVLNALERKYGMSSDEYEALIERNYLGKGYGQLVHINASEE